MGKFDWPITSKKKTYREAPQNRRLYFEIQSSSPLAHLYVRNLGTLCSDTLTPTSKFFFYKTSTESPLSKWKVNGGQSTLLTKHNLKKKPPSPAHPQEKKKGGGGPFTP